jgi:phosphatidylglycerophosphate synthase
MPPLRRLAEPPNLLSLSRLPLAALVWLAPHRPAWLLTLLAAAAVTDWLDGVVARRMQGRVKRHGTDDIGAWLDPLCDKVFVVSAACAVVWAYGPPWQVLVLMLVRDLATAVLVPTFRVAAGRHAFHRHDFRAVHVGKITTVLQFATMLAIIFIPKVALSLAFAAALTGTAAIFVAARHAQHTVHLHRRAMMLRT